MPIIAQIIVKNGSNLLRYVGEYLCNQEISRKQCVMLSHEKLGSKVTKTLILLNNNNITTKCYIPINIQS